MRFNKHDCVCCKSILSSRRCLILFRLQKDEHSLKPLCLQSFIFEWICKYIYVYIYILQTQSRRVNSAVQPRRQGFPLRVGRLSVTCTSHITPSSARYQTCKPASRECPSVLRLSVCKPSVLLIGCQTLL